MPHRNLFTNADEALAFMTAGKATVTLVSRVSQKLFTYRVTKKEDIYFVACLIGPDNTRQYSYMGIINRNNEFHWTRRSRFQQEAPAVRAFHWAWTYLRDHTMPASLEVWHEGRCGRCGRMLTVPESITRGIGPECERIQERSRAAVAPALRHVHPTLQPALAFLTPPSEQRTTTIAEMHCGTERDQQINAELAASQSVTAKKPRPDEIDLIEQGQDVC